MVSLSALILPSTRASEGQVKEEAVLDAEHQNDPQFLRGDANAEARLPLAVALNIICVVLLVDKTLLMPSGITMFSNGLFLLARSLVFVGLTLLQPGSGDYTLLAYSLESMLSFIGLLATPVLTMLTLVLVMIPPTTGVSNYGVFAHTATGAAWWAASIYIARQQMTNTCANLGTLAETAQVAILGVDSVSVLGALASFGISATQSILVLRPNAVARRSVYLLATAFVLLFWHHEDPRLTAISAISGSSQLNNLHPIDYLVMQNRARFASMSAKQSQTIQEAVVEYRRRYGREPPLGFDKWFKAARDHAFVLPDEFDTFMQSLEPFHSVHPSILQQRLQKAIEILPSERRSIIEFKSGKMTASEVVAELATRLMSETWVDILPYNMTIMINRWDEAMVNVPFNEVNRAFHDAKNTSYNNLDVDPSSVNPLTFIDTSKQDGWAATASACSFSSPSRQDQCPEQELSSPLKFIENTTTAMDVCQNCGILRMHGLLLSPVNMLANDLVPIWSGSKPLHFQDLLYPQAYYMGVRSLYDEYLDSHWNDKDNKFYWVGHSNGGFATNGTWRHLQRQRLVLKTNHGNTDPVQYLVESIPGKWEPRFSTMAEVSDLFVTRIPAIYGFECDDETCAQEEEVFQVNADSPLDSIEASYAHKFVMDIDGNSYSGRYYRLLQSKSVVVKSTIVKEWHDDRLIPWVHFVPLSLGYTELPEMARFLATTERGLQLSEVIARESTEWHNKALRDVNLQLAWLRMLLEYGRLMQPELTM